MASADRSVPGPQTPRAQSAATRASVSSDPKLIRIGRVAGAHGLDGSLRVRPDNPASDALSHASRVILELDNLRRDYRIRSSTRAGAGMIRLALEGIANTDAADAQRGAIVMIAADDLPPRGPREFYYFEAVGCEVVLTDGRPLGIVAEVMATGANEVLVVRSDAKETLVPVIEDVVKSMDLKARRIVVEPVPGLLE